MGDQTAMIDISKGDFSSMGLFRVVKILGDNVTAVEAGDIDPIWRGYLFKDQRMEHLPPPQVVMMLTKKGR